MGQLQMVSRSATAILLLATSCAAASENEVYRIGASRFTRPILRLDSDTSMGVIRQLRFDQDDSGQLWLYSAGDDKLIRKYLVRLETDRSTGLLPIDVFRWPIDRRESGVVYAMDLCRCSNGEAFLAVGGIGTYYASQVNLFGLTSATDTAVLMHDEYGLRRQSVWSLAFSPRNRVLAVGYGGDPQLGDAKLALYKVSGADLRRIDGNRDHVFSVEPGFGRVDFLAFDPTGSSLAAAEMETGRVKVYRLQNRATTRLEQISEHEVESSIYGLAWEDKSTWLVAVWTNGVLRNGQNAQSFGLSGIVAVTCAPTRELTAVGGYDASDADRPWRVVLRSRNSEDATELEGSRFEDVITSLVFSSDGQYLAAAGRSRSAASPDTWVNEIRVWSTAGGELLARFPQKGYEPETGGCISNVAITDRGSRGTVLFAHGSFPVNIAGQLEELTPLPQPQQEFFLGRTAELHSVAELSPDSDEHLPGWSPQQWIVSPEEDGQYFLIRSEPDAEWLGPFPVLPQQGSPRAAVQFSKGSGQFLAVGYDFGILVWDLSAVDQGKAISFESQHEAIARGFPGHDGEVTCLAVREDDEPPWLVSGASDGTICAWSLRGLEADANVRNELLVQFKEQDGELSVVPYKEDDPEVSSGPGVVAGFRNGQKILDVIVPREGVPEKEWNTPRERWKQTLEHPIPGRLLVAKVTESESRAKPLTIVSYVLHEPLFTFCPLRDENWIVWTPSGALLSSRDEVLNRFGWHVNLSEEVGSQVRFFPLDVFFDDYYESGKVRRLLGERIPLPPPRQTRLPSQVRITSVSTAAHPEEPAISMLAGPENLLVNIDVSATSNEEIVETQVWCNGSLVSAGSPKPRAVTIPKRLLRCGQNNTIAGVVKSEFRIPDSAESTSIFGRDVKTLYVGGERRSKLHYLGIGVTHLEHASAFRAWGAPPLQFAANDAFALGQALQRQADGGWFAAGRFRFLLNKNDLEYATDTDDQFQSPTREAILKSLDELAQAVSADDLVCILLSGHGFDRRGETESFFFVAEDTKPTLDNSVTREEIYAALRRLPCATLLLIDACRSGQITSNRSLQDLGILSLGPEILTACKGGESSYEQSGLWRNPANGEWIGHGFFTTTLLEALSGQQLAAREQTEPLALEQIDRDQDGLLSVDELGVHVKRRVAVLLKLFDRADKQSPEILPSLTFPSDRIRFALR